MENMDRVIPVVQEVINKGEAVTNYPLTLTNENNSKHFVWSVLRTNTSLTELQGAYHDAFPRSPSINMAQQVHNELLHISQFLQQCEWPFCTNPKKCRRPNDYHVSDLAICMMETIESLPQGVHVKKFFGVPLLIFEIEGSKDVWGCNQQEGKVMHEVVSALSFMPQCFLVFMYPRHFAFWHAEKDPSHACIKIKCELMQITDVNTGIGGGGLSVSSWRKLSLS